MIWKSIPDFYGYFASDSGEIRGRRGRILKPMVRRGYVFVTADGLQCRVARLVCAAFHGPAPSIVHQAAHKNSIRNDNRPENLYWATPAENGRDLAATNKQKGQNHISSKLTNKEAADIKARRAKGESIRYIHTIYSHVCYATLSHICNGRTWTHV